MQLLRTTKAFKLAPAPQAPAHLQWYAPHPVLLESIFFYSLTERWKIFHPNSRHESKIRAKQNRGKQNKQRREPDIN